VRELRFEGDGRFSAQLACNRLQGRYRIEAGALSLMPGPMTRRACWGDGPQAAENRVLEQLQRVWAFDLDAQGRLQLRQTDGALLTLEALASTR
jgi:heat shock protein HslJ